MTSPRTARHFAVGGWLWTGRPDGAGERLRQLVCHGVHHLKDGERLSWIAGVHGAPELPPQVDVIQSTIPSAPLALRTRAQRRELPALVHAHGIDVLEGPALPLPDKLPCTVVTTLHDLRDLRGWRRNAPAPLMRWVYRRALRRAGAVFTPSQATAADLERMGLYDAHKVTVVPNGTADHPEPRTPASPPFLLHVGHLEPRKNLALAVNTLALLRARNVNCRLVLAGRDGGSEELLRRHVKRLDLSDHVEFAGGISNAARDELYRTCAAVVVPSLLEGFGLAALEGLAWGAPTLVTTNEALVEVVGDAGISLAPQPDLWADALEPIVRTISTDGDARRKAHAAQWNWPRAASTWLVALRASLNG